MASAAAAGARADVAGGDDGAEKCCGTVRTGILANHSRAAGDSCGARPRGMADRAEAIRHRLQVFDDALARV